MSALPKQIFHTGDRFKLYDGYYDDNGDPIYRYGTVVGEVFWPIGSGFSRTHYCVLDREDEVKEYRLGEMHHVSE